MLLATALAGRVPGRLRDPLVAVRLEALRGHRRLAHAVLREPRSRTCILAIAVGPLAIRLIRLALVRRDFVAHRRLARVTLPIWLYVAASGWIVYYMLYRMQF